MPIATADMPSRETLREVVAAWLRDAVGTSSTTAPQVNAILGKTPLWLEHRMQAKAVSSVSVPDLHAIARVLERRVPSAVEEAALALDYQPKKVERRVKAFPVPVSLASCATAADEVQLILQAAVGARPSATRERDLRAVRARFAVGTAHRTLEVIAADIGTSVPRAAQIERQIVAAAKSAFARHRLPLLESVRRHAEASRGEPVELVERQLREQLGPIPLTQALRFLELVHPRGASSATEPMRIAGGATVRVLAAPPEDHAKLLPVLAKIAYRANERAGAYQVRDLRASLADAGHDVEPKALRALFEVMPGHRWVDPKQAWGSLVGETWLTRRVTQMLAAAGVPLSLPTVMAGLKREERRPRSDAGDGTPLEIALPPAAVVAGVLRHHDQFETTREGFFTLAQPTHVRHVLPASAASLVNDILARGNAATRSTLVALAARRGDIGADGVGTLLSFAGYLESAGNAVWKVRGRSTTPAAIAAALADQPGTGSK